MERFIKVLPDDTANTGQSNLENINDTATCGVWVSFPRETTGAKENEIDTFTIVSARQGYLEDYSCFYESPIVLMQNAEITFTPGKNRKLTFSKDSRYTHAINFSKIHERLVIFDLSGAQLKVIMRLQHSPYLVIEPNEYIYPSCTEWDWDYKSTTIQFTLEKDQLNDLRYKFQQNGIDVYFTKLRTEELSYVTLTKELGTPQFPFKFVFSVNQLFSRHPWLPDLKVEIFEELFALYNENPKLFVRTLLNMKLEERFPNVVESIRAKIATYNNYVKFKKVKKIIITPSRIIFKYTQDAPSRALRILTRHFLLRVSFRDENGKVREHHPVLFERLKRAVIDGLRFPFVAEHFEFFGSTNSQLKQKSAIFLPDAVNKRSLLGEFSGNPGSILARIGLNFSTSIPTIAITNEHDCIEDVDVEVGGEIASDGIGTISSHLLDATLTCLGPSNTSVDAIQIRYKGYKGVLCRKYGAPDNQIVFRKSMRKFESNYNTIDVLNCSAARVVRLNRQVILLLYDAGIPDHIFFELVINNLCSELENFEDKAKSKQVLSYILPRIGDLLRRHHEFDVRTDKFLWSILQKHFSTKFKLIFKKFNFEVKEGVMLLGVMDEHDELEANQVYFTWKFPGESTYGVLEEGTKVVIFRHPAILPEDIRIATYTSKVSDNLKKLSNVLVFSRRGDPEPFPVKCGGDLDGDQYAIIWDKRLVPRNTRQSHYTFDAVPKKPEKYCQEIGRASCRERV